MDTPEIKVLARTAKERAFWHWWADVESYQHLYSLRMAFDAGYTAAKGEE
jgi:hypothetical protein